MKLSTMFFSTGVGTGAADTYAQILEVARSVEAEGFDRIWLPERHFVDFGAVHPAPAVVAAAIAVQTRRIRIAAGSVVAPLHDPIRIAEEWSVVDNLSRGRIDLAFASGWRPEDFTLAPEAWIDRKAVLRRRVAEVRSLWSGAAIERATQDGGTTQVRILPPPYQEVLPAWITAARSQQTFELAGELGANVLTYVIDLGFEGLRDRIAAYRSARARAGHGGPGLVTAMVHTHLGADTLATRARVSEGYRRMFGRNHELIASANPTVGHPRSSDATLLADAQLQRMFAGLAMTGSVDDGLAVAGRLHEIGVDEIACLVDFLDDPTAVADGLPHLAALRAQLQRAAPSASAHSTSASARRIEGDRAEFYSYIRELGGDCGPHFQRVERFVADESEATCDLGFGDVGGDRHERALLLDAAISTAHAIGLTPGLRASSMPLALPAGIGRVTFYPAREGDYTAHTVRRGEDLTSMTFDVDVRTRSGARAVHLEGLRFQRLPAQAHDPRTVAARGAILEPRWVPTAGVTPGSPPRSIRLAALDADAEDIARSLAQRALPFAPELSACDSAPDNDVDCDLERAARTLVVWIAHPLTLADERPEVVHRAVTRLGEVVSGWSRVPRHLGRLVVVAGAHQIRASDPLPTPAAAGCWAAAASIAADPRAQGLLVVDVDRRAPLADQLAIACQLAASGRTGAVALRDHDVLVPRLEQAPPQDPPPRVPVGEDILVTGGTGALGRWLVSWLVEEGARRIRIVGRGNVRPSWCEALRRRAQLEVVAADLGDPVAIRAVAGPQCFDAVFHLAGDLGDRHGSPMTSDAVERAIRPKLDGLVHVWEALSSTPSRLVLFSSLAAVAGSAGQPAYAAANAAMSAAAARLPGIERCTVSVIHFGPWAGGGMASGARMQAALEAKGVMAMPPWIALRSLGDVLARNRTDTVIAHLRGEPPAAAAAWAPARRPSRVLELAAFAKASSPERLRWLQAEVIRRVAAIMNIPDANIDASANLYDLGFDSLMAIELKNAVFTDFGVSINLADLMDSASASDLAAALLPHLVAVASGAADAAPRIDPGSSTWRMSL